MHSCIWEYKGIGRGAEGVCGDFLTDQLSYTLQTVRYNTDGQQSLDVLFSYTVFSCCFAVEAAFCGDTDPGFVLPSSAGFSLLAGGLCSLIFQKMMNWTI